MVLPVSVLDNNHLLLPRMSRTLSTVVGGSPESGRTTRGPTPKGEEVLVTIGFITRHL